MEALSKSGAAPKWGAGLGQIDRRNVFLGELSRVGIRKSDIIGEPSVRNDAAFLYTLVGVTSVVAVAAGQLPGDWVGQAMHLHLSGPTSIMSDSPSNWYTLLHKGLVADLPLLRRHTRSIPDLPPGPYKRAYCMLAGLLCSVFDRLNCDCGAGSGLYSARPAAGCHWLVCPSLS